MNKGKLSLIFAIITVIFTAYQVLRAYQILRIGGFILDLPNPVLFILFLISFICSILAVIFGTIGIKKNESKRMAIAGLIIGLIELVGYILFMIFMFLLSISPGWV